MKAKRAFDIAVSAAALVALSPVFAVVSGAARGVAAEAAGGVVGVARGTGNGWYVPEPTLCSLSTLAGPAAAG